MEKDQTIVPVVRAPILDEDDEGPTGCNAGTPPVQEIEVDVIIPVHNAAATIEEAIQSVLDQKQTDNSNDAAADDCTLKITIYICCYDDGSEDKSWSILQEIQRKHQQATSLSNHGDRKSFETHILLKQGSSPPRGAGYARNRAAEMRASSTALLCWLDSDDIMQSTRIIEQTRKILTLPQSALLGTLIDRIPAGSTWHYTQWINNLTDERLMLERFRELTVIQPTWMMRKTQFEAVGGYIEAPVVVEDDSTWKERWYEKQNDKRLILPTDKETPTTLRVAEDLRFFHEHLATGGSIHLIRKRLVIYRHREGESQSSKTPRKLLAQLRTQALERCILRHWDQFIVWGAGRDGKDFIKSLSDPSKLYCIVDVDDTKIARGFYETREWKIPIVHFSTLAPDPELYTSWKTSCRPVGSFATMQKGRDGTEERIEACRSSPNKKTKIEPEEKKDPGMLLLNESLLRSLPVIVCVAMYRSNGALEHNVSLIGRTEGVNLYHFN